MLSGILIISFSLVLFLYWLRYSCVLLLDTYTKRRTEGSTVPDVTSSLADVYSRLLTGEALDPIRASLDRDYRVLAYLLQHASGMEMASIEDRLLVLDYRLMKLVYAVTRTAAPERARRALGEMASVLDCMVDRMGERTAARDEA